MDEASVEAEDGDGDGEASQAADPASLSSSGSTVLGLRVAAGGDFARTSGCAAVAEEPGLRRTQARATSFVTRLAGT